MEIDCSVTFWKFKSARYSFRYVQRKNITVFFARLDITSIFLSMLINPDYNLAGPGITQEMDLWECQWGNVSVQLTEEDHCKSGQYHPVGWGAKLNKKTKGSRAFKHLSLCILSVAVMCPAASFCPNHTSSHSQGTFSNSDSPPKLRPSSLKLLLVRYLVTAAGKKRNTASKAKVW